MTVLMIMMTKLSGAKVVRQWLKTTALIKIL